MPFEGLPGGKTRVHRTGRLATIGAIGLAAAAIAVTGCTAQAVSAAPVAFAKPAGAAAPAASAAPAAMTGTVAKTVTASVTAPAYKPPTRNLAEGMAGSDVKALQERLAALKYYPGAIDSEFGGNTQAALWAFQEINGIKVTGVVDEATKKALVHPKAYK